MRDFHLIGEQNGESFQLTLLNADPASAESGKRKLFFKGDELFYIDSAGNIYKVANSGASASFPILSVSSNTTLDGTHFTVRVDASGGNVTITLPKVSDVRKRIYNIAKVDNSNKLVTIQPDGTVPDTIGLTHPNFSLKKQGEVLGIQAADIGDDWTVI